MLYIKQYLRYIHNIKLLKFSSLCSCCCGGGLRCRSPMRLSGSPAAVAAAAMPQPARPKAGPTKRQQHSSTTKEQLLWGGASLRSPMRLSGEESRRRPNSPNSRTAEQPEQLPPLPSASVGFPVPQLFIIVPFYKY